MPYLSPEYRAYIDSDAWLLMRERKFRQVGRRCQKCGYGPYPLQVHHQTYKRLGHEWLSDLQVLCIPCHEKVTRRTRRNRKIRRFLGI